MFQRVIPVVICAFLAGCSDPLAGLDRFRDLDVASDDPSPAALPTEEEIAREGYFGTSAAEGGAVAAGVPAPEVAPAPKRGLFGLLRRNAPTDPQADAVAAAVAQSTSEISVAESPAAADVTPELAALEPGGTAPATETPAQTGFFGRLLGRAMGETAVEQTPDTAAAMPAQDAAAESELQLAALSPAPEDTLSPAPTAARTRTGLFGLRNRKAPAAGATRTGPDARDVDYGTVLPFGEVARSCVSRGRPLGRKIDRAPAGGYTLFDTKPDTAGPRTFYITGFNDGCPRQFTAANVLLGSASLYERLHYGPGGEHLPRGATDKAYEGVKRQVCGVGKRKPCGAQIKKMERSTFFVTAYSRFGNANTWSELLVHDGEVLAAAVKSNN